MRLRFNGLLLEIDAEATARFYAAAGTDADACACAGCRNYRLAAERFPEEVKAFFRKLGIDAGKAAEIIPWYAEDGGRAMHYGGFYHLCGRRLTDAAQAEDAAELDFHPIAEGYRVAFTEDISLPEAALPAPALQMEIDFCGVPWLLETENTD